MTVFSINDLEQLSGIKAHTIRIWEKRYGIIKPSRTAGNIRFYDDDDLKLLMNVSFLNTRGYKISKIAKLSPNEIATQVSNSSTIKIDEDLKVDALTLSLLNLDDSKFTRFLDCNIEQHGFEHTMIHVIYPLLDKLSLMWISGTTKSVQENFIVNLVKQKIIGAIENLKNTVDNEGSQFLLFLPKSETQELSLLFMQYLLKSRGHKVINLGAEIDLTTLNEVCTIVQPEFIFTMVNDSLPDKMSLLSFQKLIQRLFPKSKLILTGFQVYFQKLKSTRNVYALNSLAETLSVLKKIKS